MGNSDNGNNKNKKLQDATTCPITNLGDLIEFAKNKQDVRLEDNL